MDIKKQETTKEQREAIQAILHRNNFLLISEGENNQLTVCMHATKEVLEKGMKDIGRYPLIRDLLTDVVIDLQTEKK